MHADEPAAGATDRRSGESRWRLGYRPPLDGIRGVAVLLVVADHFNVPGFGGAGHVGVTTFFVLSGFLITALLLEEHARSGGIDLRAFYVRRARRLLPPLVVMLAIFVAFELARGEIESAAPRALAALLYVANFAKAAMNLGPLTHTWSLAVEEQFYAVWPAVVLLALTVRGRRAVAVTALVAGATMLAARAAGIGLADLDRSIDALMIGALVALAALAGRLPGPTVGYLGASVLAVTALIPWEPGWREGWTVGLLAASLATAAMIAAVSNQPSLLARALSWRPLTGIGRVSYALYLWHFLVGWAMVPTLAAAGWHWSLAAAVMFAVSLGAALASWRYVEGPLQRRWRSGPGRATAPPATSRAAAGLAPRAADASTDEPTTAPAAGSATAESGQRVMAAG